MRADAYHREVDILLSEGDNIVDAILTHGLDMRDFNAFRKVVGAKASNNKIGFAKIEVKNVVVKIFIFPKTFGSDKDKNRLISYMNLFFKITKKYPEFLKKFDLESEIDLFFLNSKKDDFSSLDDFFYEKYNFFLDEIFDYFKVLRLYKTSKSQFVSNSLSYELDIEKSIIDPIKSNLHQKKDVETIDARRALIILSGLRILLKERASGLQKDFLDRVKNLANFLSEKFFIKTQILNKKEVLDRKSYKIFLKEKDKKIYNYMLALLGFSDVFDNHLDEKISSFSKIKMQYVFFEANMMFEMFVYDRLVLLWGSSNVRFKQSLEFCFYDLNDSCVKKLKAEPDFIVDSPFFSQKIVLDAKWKIMTDIDSSYVLDFLKLSRDCKLADACCGYLIYPVVKEGKLLQVQPFYLGDDHNFKCYILEMPLGV